MSDVAYRCGECAAEKTLSGHEHLRACAEAVAFGPVAAEGAELERHDDVSDAGGFREDSIICDVHFETAIEKRLEGKWCRWKDCEVDGCDGGTVPVFEYAPRGRRRPCEGCDSQGGHWVPVEVACEA